MVLRLHRSRRSPAPTFRPPTTSRGRVMTKIEISTRDGICPSYVFRPTGEGPWPAVLIYMDGIGIRPAILEVGERLATQPLHERGELEQRLRRRDLQRLP